MPVTLVEIDTLILFKVWLGKSEHSIDKVLNQYHALVKLNHEGIITQDWVDRSVMSFSSFAKQYFLNGGMEPDLPALTDMYRQIGLP
jgi:hypothetical protein